MSELYKEIIGDSILNDIMGCLKNDRRTAALLLTYCAMDAMETGEKEKPVTH